MRSEIYHWFDRTTSPHPSVTAVPERRTARLAARMIVALLPFAVLVAFYLFIVQNLREGLSVLAASVTVFLGYLLVRSPRPAWGVALLVVTIWLLVAWLWVGDLLVDARADRGFVMVLPVLLAALLLAPLPAAVIAGATVLMGAIIAADAVSRTHSIAGPEVGVLLFLVAACAVAVVGSVTLRRSLQDQEAANARLTEIDTVRRRLLGFIAHDLANPIQAIDMNLFVQRSNDPTGAGSDSNQRSIDQLKFLIQDVRDLAQAETKSLRIDPRPIQLREKLQDALRLVAARSETYGVAVNIEAQQGLQIQADPGRFDQVMVNLVTNALKFSPAGATVHVSAEAHGKMAHIHVRDEGRGLIQDEIDRLFKPFSQVHKLGESRERGTGLGLVITKGIVEAHGGRIWVESAGHGHGSTFTVEMPLVGGSILPDGGLSGGGSTGT